MNGTYISIYVYIYKTQSSHSFRSLLSITEQFKHTKSHHFPNQRLASKQKGSSANLPSVLRCYWGGLGSVLFCNYSKLLPGLSPLQSSISSLFKAVILMEEPGISFGLYSP